MQKTYEEMENKFIAVMDGEFADSGKKPDVNLVSTCVEGILLLYPEKCYACEKEERESRIGIIAKIIEIQQRKYNSRKIIRIILVAAAILLLLATSVLGYGQLKYNIFNFGDHSTISTQKVFGKLEEGLTIGYIPSGFVLQQHNIDDYQEFYGYINGNKTLLISKESFFENINIDTENGSPRIVNVNGIDYIITGDGVEWCSVSWLTSKYSYAVSGSLPEQELIKIACKIS